MRGVQTAGGALQDLLPAAADRDLPAVSRALGPEGHGFRLPGEPTGQRILKRDPLNRSSVEGRRKSRSASPHVNTDFGGGGKGVPLYMVDGQHIVRELVCAFGVFVGRVALPVDSGQQVSQVSCSLHDIVPPLSCPARQRELVFRAEWISRELS